MTQTFHGGPLDGTTDDDEQRLVPRESPWTFLGLDGQEHTYERHGDRWEHLSAEPIQPPEIAAEPEPVPEPVTEPWPDGEPEAPQE